MLQYCLRVATAGLFVVIAACTPDAASLDGPSGPLNDMALGQDTAPVTLIEYASVTCGACFQYHRDVVPAIKDMVDDGRVRFIFREFPTAPEEVAIAGFAIARCAGEDEAYFAVLDDLFANQSGILAASRNGSVRAALEAVAARHGVDAAEFEACLADPDVRTDIANATKQGRAEGVTGTPTLFLNGRVLQGAEGRSPESITELVNAIAPPPAE